MEQWRRLRERGDGWYWMIRGARHGDLYHLCSLAAPFAALHGEGLPIYLVADRAGQAQVAALFADRFAEIIVDDSFPTDEDAWRRLFAEEGMPWFGPNVPLFLHPTMVLDPTRITIAFAQENQLTWMEMYKNILRLPGDAEPAAPAASLQLAGRARAFCKTEGVPDGRAAILFPYAQSLPVESLVHFATLAADLRGDGLEVFTSVAGDEVPVTGTRPLKIPFDILLDVAEYAGRIVAVRSGICDITATARCIKTFVYPNAEELRPWSVGILGFARDAHEVLFAFHMGSPADFSALVRSGPGFGTLAAPSRHLSTFVGAGLAAPRLQTIAMTDVLDGAPLMPAEPPAALIVHGVAPRTHPRLRAGINQVIAGLIARYGADARYYACRDGGFGDYYEEVDARALAAGQYVVAGFWHSIVIVLGGRLEDFLSRDAREKVLALEPMAPGNPTIRPADYRHSPAGLAAVARVRPLSVGGVQLLEGWLPLEPWGVWSDARRVTLKLVLPEPPAQDAELRLEVIGATSVELPRIPVAIAINGDHVLTHTLILVDGPQEMLVPLAAVHARRQRVLTVTFAFLELTSAQERGLRDDPRLLGIGLREIGVRARAAGDTPPDAPDA